MVHVENLAFVHSQRFNTVLIGVRMDRVFKGLSQNVLTAFRIGDQPVDRQDLVVCDERISGREKAKIAFDD